MDIKKLGKGALPSPPDKRNWKLSFLAGAVKPVDWALGFFNPEPPDSDQDSADCCVAEATTYFHWQLTGKKFSVKSIFAYIYLSYGAYLKDGPDRVVRFGQELFTETPDPDPKTMANMRDKSGLNPADAEDDKALRFFETGGSMDQLAQAVRDWKGVIFGLTGSNEGWSDLTNPKPPKPNSGEWGHALYGFGYHMHNGKKCLVAKSSWCGNGHHVHHINEDYFNSGYVYSQAFVLVGKENMPEVKRYRVNFYGTLGIALWVPGSFDIDIRLAKSQAMYENLLKDYEVPADAAFLINLK